MEVTKDIRCRVRGELEFNKRITLQKRKYQLLREETHETRSGNLCLLVIGLLIKFLRLSAESYEISVLLPEFASSSTDTYIKQRTGDSGVFG